jgi:hypothetical protein
MTAQGQSIADRPARFLPGVRMLVVDIAALLGGIVLIVVTTHQTGAVADQTGTTRAPSAGRRASGTPWLCPGMSRHPQGPDPTA